MTKIRALKSTNIKDDIFKNFKKRKKGLIMKESTKKISSSNWPNSKKDRPKNADQKAKNFFSQ